MLKIKKGEKVQILAGKDRGKRSEVTAVFPHKNKVTVKGINMITKHIKPRQATQPGERITIEGPIDLSNVALVCPHTDKPTRVGFVIKEGTKVRISKKSGKEID